MRLIHPRLATPHPEPIHKDSVLIRLVARGDVVAVELSARPLRVLAYVLALDLGLAACFAAVGPALFDDRAALFRELAPATILSFLQLLLIAATAHALHVSETATVAWHRSFWGLSAAIFLVFAFDEITQSAIFISDLLEDGLGLSPTGGFHDIEAVLLTLLFAAAGLVLLPRALVLVRHPVAVLLFAIAVGLGAGSQMLDSFAPATDWEFVAEEALKLSAGAFFLGGFLRALQDVRRRDVGLRPEPAERPRVV